MSPHPILSTSSNTHHPAGATQGDTRLESKQEAGHTLPRPPAAAALAAPSGQDSSAQAVQEAAWTQSDGIAL